MSQPVSVQEEIRKLVFDLESYLTEIEINHEKMECLLNDIVQSFFDKDTKSNDGRFSILYQYPEYTTKSQITTDYMFNAQDKLSKATELYRQLFKLVFRKDELNE